MKTASIEALCAGVFRKSAADYLFDFRETCQDRIRKEREGRQTFMDNPEFGGILTPKDRGSKMMDRARLRFIHITANSHK